MKVIFLSIGLILFSIGGMVYLLRNAGAPSQGASVSTVVDGKQMIEVRAKGGYEPRVISAKANMPTVLRVNTQGTFDCSAALSIPRLGYRANLPPSGATDIEVPPQAAGTSLQGVCAMGMYHFAVNFQ